MRTRPVYAALFAIGLGVGSSALSQETTPNAHAAQERLRAWFADGLKDRDDVFLNAGGSPQDIEDIKRCAVDAYRADIPDEVAVQLAPMLDHKVPMDAMLAAEWLAPDRGVYPERYEHMSEYVARVCPQFMSVLSP